VEAARRRTPEDLAALDDALAAREAAWRGGRVAGFVAADAALHTAVVAAAHNRMLAELYASVGAAMRSTLTQAMGDALTPDRHVDHARLVDAIRAGDPELAARGPVLFWNPYPGHRLSPTSTGHLGSSG
jgi:DNA-binding FadR family transcriptional regulator